MKQLDLKKEYYDLIKEYYTKNSSFIDKAIFAFTGSAISFLLGFMQSISEELILMYIICIAVFIFTLILQLVSAKVAQVACDKGYDENKLQQAFDLFDIARFLNNLFLTTFCIAVVLTTFSITFNFYKKQKPQNYSVEYSVTTPQYKYKERKEFMPNNRITDGSINSKSDDTYAQDAQIIPKSMQEALVLPKTIQDKMLNGQNSTATTQQQTVQQQQDKK